MPGMLAAVIVCSLVVILFVAIFFDVIFGVIGAACEYIGEFFQWIWTKPWTRRKVYQAEKKFNKYLSVKKEQQKILHNDWLKLFGEEGRPRIQWSPSFYTFSGFSVTAEWREGNYADVFSVIDEWHPERDERDCKCFECYAHREEKDKYFGLKARAGRKVKEAVDYVKGY